MKKYKVDPFQFGTRLNEIRRARELKQHQLASLLGVTTNFISDIERGAKLPSVSVLYGLSSVLDVPSDYFLGETSKTSSEIDRTFMRKKIEAALSASRSEQQLLEELMTYLSEDSDD